ncbi:MAG TPA: hypothetical protein VLI90_08070 [Tepidisphaeraceae bacterium]|nr:hypothetical protein [Tepidisphaeraceae bacterium]
MKRLIPGRKELALFATLAIVLSSIVSMFQVSQHDLWLAALAMPMFVFAAVLGLRRSPQWQPLPEEVAAAVETSNEQVSA